MKTLLISLVSDQTLPNVQLIKELKKDVDDYLFITTEGMEKKGCRLWIERATEIKNLLPPCVVQQFSFDDIITKLDEIDFTSYNRLIVNLTGGTKIITLSAHDYFKELGAEIYYVTGTNNEYIKIFPGRKKQVKQFKQKITIDDYLKSYGFESQSTEDSRISDEYTRHLFDKYCENQFEDHVEALTILRGKRNKGLKDILGASQFVAVFLSYIDFPIVDNQLSALEVNYLTGEWLEEYIGERIKEELGLSEEEILIGVKLEKELPSKQVNSARELLGEDAPLKEKSPDNEIDVMFTYNNRFYTVECKTSIIDIREFGQNEDGSTRTKEVNILGETIYKADYLKNRFGLFAHSTILSLTDFQKYIDEFPNDRNNRTKKMEDLINRCNLSGIRLIDGRQMRSGLPVSKLILP